MNEDYSEDYLDFSQMSRDELYDIVNSSLGVYRQQVVDGAKNELLRREREGVPAESYVQATNGEARPHVPPAEVRPPAPPEVVPSGRLYSEWQTALATWLGSPLAGCLLLARNYEVLENRRAAWQSLAAGVAGTLLLFAVIVVLPENFPAGRGISIATGFAMHQITKQLQGAAIDEHLKAGGEKGSWAVTVFAGIVVAGIVLALSVAVAIILDLG